MAKKYIDYFQEQLKIYLPEGITFSMHDDFNYDAEDVDVKITLIKLTGTIDSGIVTLPYQLIAEAKIQYALDVRNALDKMAIELAESEIIIVDDNNTEVKTRQFFSTSYIVSRFVNDGLDDRNFIALNITLNHFSNIDISTIELTSITSSATDVINYQSIASAVVLSPLTLGANINNGGFVSQTPVQSSIGVSFVFVPQNTELQRELLKNALTGNNYNYRYNIKYTIVDTFGKEEIISLENMTISSNSVSKQRNGISTITIAFVRGD